MFLPANLYDALAYSSIGQGQRVVSDTVVYDFRNAGSVPGSLERNMPTVVCWILFVLGVLISRSFFDILIFTLTGLVGVALLCLWCFTDHSVTRWNQNLLWACPLNLIAIWVGARFKRAHFSVYTVLLAAGLICFLFAPGYFDRAVLPLLLLLLFRSVRVLKKRPVGEM